jgi:hypothetical protein
MDAPIRVGDALMRQLAVPVTGDGLLGPFVNRKPERWSPEPPGPQNLAFADGLDGWMTDGSFQAEVTGSHWHDYAAAAASGIATLSAAVPRPYGNAVLGQSFAAGDYRGATVSLRADVRTEAVTGKARLWLRTVSQDPGRDTPGRGHAITGSQDWHRHDLTLQVPGDAEVIQFGITLTGPGQAGLRNVELTCTS